MVLQWCMNSTGSRQPTWLNSTIVKPSSCLSSKRTCVPTHSSGPSTTSQSTSSGAVASITFMSKPSGTGANRNSMTPPGSLLPFVVSVHQPLSPSIVVRAA